MKQIYFIFLLITLSSFKTNAQTANSLHFDGINDDINCGNDNSLQITGSNITLEAIIKLESFATNIWDGNVINKEQIGGSGGYMLRIGNNGIVQFDFGELTSWHSLATPENTLVLNVFYHIVATYDGANMKIYIDGVETASKELSEINISNSSSDLFIGSWSQSDRHINGTISDIRIWNITRSNSDISTNVDNELTLPQTGLVAYYKFNQGISNGNNTTETTLNDETDNNNGILNNFTLNGSVSNWINNNIVLSINDLSLSNKDVKIHPNPSSEFIEVSNLEVKETYRFYDVLGTEIKNGTTSSNEQIDIRDFSNGIYFLKFDNRNSIKFIKE